ncbi:hypothetical protein QYE76_008937 [Lolium multiflorum]|uniref:Gag-pol polyprotein n=1 Tax=Lolium multiflorum TaxID=4521 RepID=A0AAD8X1F5_LOLMU|nr:hypothetical protein QYE76_008937 [Lolium multiflorum]
MENYSLLMGVAAVMKMAVEMAAVSMKKPSGGTSPLRQPCRNRDSCPPDLGLAMAAALEASLVAQEENVDVNFIKNNNFNNNAYRNNSGNNYRPYPSNNGNGYGNSYGNSYNNNRNVPSGLEAMLKEFISTQTAFNKSVEEKLDKIDILASRVDRLASDVDLLKLKVMPNKDIDNKIVTTANAIQVRINENIRLMAELRARWDREENEKLAKENNVAKVWTITTTSNDNDSHVATPPTINGKIIGVGKVTTPSTKRAKLPEIAKTAETACDKTAEIFSNIGDNDPIAVDHNGLDFDDCHISEVIKFLQKLARSPNASAINLAFTKHITNALIKAREEKLKLETSIPRKLEDGWEPIIKMRVNDFDCNALCDLGASISVMPKKLYDMLDLPPLKNCYLDVNLADNAIKKPLGRIDNVRIMVNNNLVPIDFVVLDIECNASCPIILGRPFLRTVGATIDMKEEMASPINFNQFLEKEKLKSNGSNFTDWFRHVRIFLSGGNLQFVLDAPLGDPPAEDESDEVKAVYATRKTRYSQVQCAILCSLESDLQKRFEHHDPHELMNELKAIFETHAAVECYEASKHFFSCMMEEGSSVSEHMLAMTGHAKKLSDLGIVIPNRLGINRVLQSLPPSYKNFVMNYNMQNMNKELPELFGMLKAAEIEIKKEHQVLMVNKTTSFKKQGKSKGKFKKGGKKAATPPMKPKNGPKPDAECYYCKEKGHWKRNCSKYLADLKSGLVKKKKEGISDIHVIDVYLTGSRSSTWVFDTGSVAHICNSKQELKNKRRLLKDEVTMRVGNGSKVDVIAVGTLPLHLPSGLVLSLNNCYFVPALSMNIISGSCLMQDGYSFKSENNGCSIFMNNIFYGRAPQKNGLFLLDLDSSDTHIHNIDAKRIKLNDNSTYMWHCRLGHIGVKRMKKLHTDGLLESLDFESLDRCEACLMGKMTKTPFSGMMERATDLLEIIHTDVCGPMSVASRGGYRYVLTFTDDLSRYGYIYFMKHKSETFEKFKEFQSEVENQRNKKIKFLRSDRGGEYLSYEFGMHLKKCGILSQLTPPGTPQRNGVSERRNRTLLDMVRSMMSLTDLPLSFWSYALETAAFTLNRAPSKSVETTPYELWFNKKPKLSFLKVWGCEAYVKKLQPDKLEPKAEKCVFIGYPKETIGYTFYHKSEGKIFVAKNGTFLEKEFLTKEVTGRKVELDEIDESILVDQSSAVPEVVPVPPTPATEEANDNDHETSNEETTEPRRSTRERATPDWYDPCLNVMIVDNNDEDPATYEEAMMSPDSNKWQEAMKSEMGSMYDNKVWTLVDLPDSRKAVENKWIFKRKTDADGNITVYKARLVAKGFRQIQGVDYDETFSPVAKLKSVRILLAIAAFFDYEIWQMDVKTAFLNGDIEEELYMVQPKGFVDPKNADKVCKLQRSIYGLKQASRSWNRRFDKVIKDFGFIQCHGEACIYKKVSGSSVAFLILYVDDILLIGNDIELLSSVKGYLNNSFSMKDLGEASYILGIKIYRDRSRRLIGLSQSTYLDKILKKFRMDESKKGFLPMLPGKVLSKTQGPATAEERERMSNIPYASAVGSIMYAMLCTRPDIAHAVSLTSRYQSDPGMEHWTAVKNILKYLKRTKDMFLCYGGDQELVVNGYTDASWNTDPDDSKSQSGYVFILNGAAVSWASSKQCTVAKSSTESEYIAASEASSEAVWMKRFIVELGVVPSALDPLIIYCDNMGAIANAQEPRSHKRLKHIKLRYHSIREYIEDGEVKICKVHTDLNVADPLTKALPRAKHDQHQNAMGVSLAKLRRTSTPPPTPRRRAVGFKRSYYFRCPLGEVDVVFINNRTCDRVRRCCPFVAPEPIVIKIFYALLQAASDRLPQQQEPPLVGFGISSRMWFIPAYFKKTQASKLGDAQGIPFFIDNIIRFL